MKKVLISIKPKWVAEILNHRKTLEIRKTAPKDLPCEVYIYCTQGKDILLMIEDYDYGSMTYYAPKPALIEKPTRKASKDEVDLYGYYKRFKDTEHEWKLNGKVVAKFTLKGVEIVEICESEDCVDPRMALFYGGNEEGSVVKACLTDGQIADYLGYGHTGYAWEISDLVIFEKPKELKDFGVKRSPQSWCYCEVDE